MSARLVVLVIAAAWLVLAPAAHAQDRGRAAGPAPRTARAAAPIDLTGYWVAFITEDWRYRMMTPPKGDYRGVPLSAEGRTVADGWNPDAATRDEACRPYGAAALMRVPGRLRITWQGDDTLRVETDAGMQVRTFSFAGPATSAAAPASWQGSSRARWDPAARSLAVVTTNLRPGYLRRNGVPYSERATVTEHFDVAPHPSDGQLLIVTTVVEDPRYLQRSFVVTSHFKKETDGSRWNPTPCTAAW